MNLYFRFIYASRVTSFAFFVQAAWKGFFLRKKLAAAFAAIERDEVDDDFEEVNLDHFMFDEVSRTQCNKNILLFFFLCLIVKCSVICDIYTSDMVTIEDVQYHCTPQIYRVLTKHGKCIDCTD